MTTDPSTAPQPATPGEALIEALEILVYERGMDPTDRDPNTCAWLPLMDVVDTIRRWADELDAAPAADPGPVVYRLPELYAVLPYEADEVYVDPIAAQKAAAELSSSDSSGFAYRAYRLVPLSTTPPAGTEAL